MAKLRVYELAEQMNKTNKEILSILKDKGIEVASHMSTLSDEQIDAVKSEKTSDRTTCFHRCGTCRGENRRLRSDGRRRILCTDYDRWCKNSIQSRLWTRNSQL